ncbi:hypothetical protein DNH61_16290 [Paenibacillus sambharensis]|uniref:Uncharacterized protein n=1 Tax=Paenibacillus sambharensis TaxID=1803190 RepID=A0A2W1L443_9BACL|nr:hypothetical protein [Paenibacillus sambharensis]PZD94788.1 hypothetical protein DNH61_16290 [Paenibacillus sambharensis]
MSDPLKNSDRVLNKSALTMPPEAGYLASLLMDLRSLRNILNETKGLLDGQPGMIFFKLHSVHAQYLYKVVAAVVKTESIDEAVREAEANVEEYVSASDRLFQSLNQVLNLKLPHSGNFAFGVMAPLLAQDREFVTAFNAYMDGYQAMYTQALESAEACYDAGKKMEQETAAFLVEVRRTVSELEAANKVDQLLVSVYKKKIDMMDLTVRTRVQEARGRAEGYVKSLHEAWLAVSKAGRLTYTGR